MFRSDVTRAKCARNFGSISPPMRLRSGGFVGVEYSGSISAQSLPRAHRLYFTSVYGLMSLLMSIRRKLELKVPFTFICVRASIISETRGDKNH